MNLLVSRISCNSICFETNQYISQ